MERIRVRNTGNIHITRNPIERFLMKFKDFCLSHRKPILLLLAGLAVACVLFICIYLYLEKRGEVLLRQYEAIMENYEKAGSGEAAASSAIADLVELRDRAGFGRIYEACLFTLGNMYFSQRDFAQAESSMEKLADTTSSELYGVLALLKAGAAAEESGNTSKALELFKRAEASYGSGVFADRIIYNLGRIYEIEGDTQGAITHYTQVIADYPMSVSAASAKKRFFTLKHVGEQ